MNRTETVELTVSPEEKALIRAAAERVGLRVAAWLRLIALENARKGAP